jgi:hypothetical protein
MVSPIVHHVPRDLSDAPRKGLLLSRFVFGWTERTARDTESVCFEGQRGSPPAGGDRSRQAEKPWCARERTTRGPQAKICTIGRPS